MIKFHTILIFLVSHTISYGQELQYGLIMPEDPNNEEICCIYSPKEGFNVYNRPGGNRIGILTRNPEQQNDFESYYQIYFVDGQTQKAAQLNPDNFQEIGYKIWAVPYFERRNGFVRIMNNKYNYWLSESEIEKQGFKLIEWQEFLADNTGYLEGYFANYPGLNLRTGPGTDSEVIMALRGAFNRILPTDEHSGPWTKVRVIIHKEHPCETRLSKENNIKEELEGWIKIVDDYGKPNVWYEARGC